MTYDDWNIHREGRAWTSAEITSRYFERTPEKIELIEGQLFWSEDDRINLLGCLLENLGADAAVRLGDPQVWREAVAALNGSFAL